MFVLNPQKKVLPTDGSFHFVKLDDAKDPPSKISTIVAVTAPSSSKRTIGVATTTERSTVCQQCTWKDPLLQTEFMKYSFQQRSPLQVVFMTMLMILWIAGAFLPVLAEKKRICPLIILVTVMVICFLSCFLWAWSCSANKDDNENKKLSFEKQLRIQMIFIVMIHLLMILPLLETLATNMIQMTLTDSALLMALTPFILTLNLCEPRYYLVLLCHSMISLVIICSLIFRKTEILFPTVIILILLFLSTYEQYRLNQSSFLKFYEVKCKVEDEESTKKETKDMIGNVAHDLKTPLASFSNGLDMIKDILTSAQDKVHVHGFSADIFADCIAEILTCIANVRNTNAFMLMTINRCIDYTKASKGMKLVPKYETVDLREALQFPIECMSNIQERIGIKLEPLSEEICSHIITDKQWLQENLLCLLSNAVKYSAEGTVTVKAYLSEVSLRSSRKHSNGGISTDHALLAELNSPLESSTCEFLLQFEVEDNGIGMSEDAMKLLFNPFQQAQRLAGGTGLGLYSLAKRLEALKGSYGVRKRNDGSQGSLFWFAIPYRADQITAEEKLGFNSSNDFNHKASLKSIGEKKYLRIDRGIEILIVDDSPSILKMSSMMFKRQGHQIWTAENGEIALKRIEEKWKESGRGFDLVLMDLQMPVMDGLEATRRLRKMESEGRDWMFDRSELAVRDAGAVQCSPVHSAVASSCSVPISSKKRSLVFGVSAHLEDETISAALEVGMDDLLEKPFSMEIFKRNIEKYFLS